MRVGIMRSDHCRNTDDSAVADPVKHAQSFVTPPSQLAMIIDTQGSTPVYVDGTVPNQHVA